MTLSEFKRDIASRTNRYTSLTAHDNSLPIEATIHISEAIVEDEHVYRAVVSAKNVTTR